MSEQHVKKKGFLESARSNPWMIASIVLAVVLIAFIIFSYSGVGLGGIGEKAASEKVLGLIQSQDPSAEIESVSKTQVYLVSLTAGGQSLPIYVSLDGNSAGSVSDISGTPPAPSVPAPTTPIIVETGDAPVKGDLNAPVTIVEFSDYQCPFCERAYSDAVTQIDENYIKTGKVKLIYMDFPLSFHPEAQPAAEAARCFEFVKGGNDAEYYKYHNKLFENQATLSEANYKKWARELGANGAQFDSCLDSSKFAADVQADAAYGESIGVSGTPAFFVNGKLVSGAQPYSVFKQMIDAELA